MGEEVSFEIVDIEDEVPGLKRDGVAVIRDGNCIAVLPEADRLRRALSLPIEEIEYIVTNIQEVIGRDPTQDEREFWKAILEYRHTH
jgi:hypothetical protein